MAGGMCGMVRWTIRRPELLRMSMAGGESSTVRLILTVTVLSAMMQAGSASVVAK